MKPPLQKLGPQELYGLNMATCSIEGICFTPGSWYVLHRDPSSLYDRNFRYAISAFREKSIFNRVHAQVQSSGPIIPI